MPSWRSGLSAGVLTALAILPLVRLAWTWQTAGAGLDFSDEGYYLAWIAQPFDYSISATQFGFVYHLLWKAVGEDLVGLRRANLVLTSVLGWWLGFTVFRRLSSREGAPRPWGRPLAAVLALATLTAYPNLFDMWLATPSYNSLCLQGLMIALTGLAGLQRGQSRAEWVFGAVLIGVGGVLAFMAKPTSAAALGVLVVAYLLVARMWHWPMLMGMAGVFVCGLLVSAWSIDGSVGAFVLRLRQAIEVAALMGIQPSLSHLVRIDTFHLSGGEWAVLLGVAGVTAVGTRMLAESRPDHAGGPERIMAVLAVAMLAAMLTAAVGVWHPDVTHRAFRGVWLLAVPLGALCALVMSLRRTWTGEVDGQQAGLVAVLAATPHVFAFGTGNNYWQSASAASCFWVLSGVCVVLPRVRSAGWRTLLPVAVAAQLLASLLFWMALGHPYRQAPLLEPPPNLARVRDGQSQLRLSPAQADYIGGLTLQAQRAGWHAGTRAIDLTGQSPGTLFVLSARPVGQPWLLGGYPGSAGSARAILTREPCEVVADAWVLVQPGGPRALPVELLAASGADLARDYRLAAEVRTPPGFGGYAATGLQQLFRPVRSSEAAVAACRHARQSRP